MLHFFLSHNIFTLFFSSPIIILHIFCYPYIPLSLVSPPEGNKKILLKFLFLNSFIFSLLFLSFIFYFLFKLTFLFCIGIYCIYLIFFPPKAWMVNVKYRPLGPGGHQEGDPAQEVAAQATGPSSGLHNYLNKNNYVLK